MASNFLVGSAQESPEIMQQQSSKPVQMLAVGRITTQDRSKLQAQMADEVADTVKLYLSGGIASWYARLDEPGIVLILNAQSEQQADELLSQLPFVEQGWLVFDYTPIGPLQPLEALLNQRANQ